MTCSIFDEWRKFWSCKRRMPGRKKIALFIMVFLILSWTISLSSSFLRGGFPGGATIPTESIPGEDFSALDNQSLVNLESLTDDVGQPSHISDENNRQYQYDPYYYYKTSLEILANNSLTFLLENLLNTTDDGFKEYVNLSGPSNSSVKLTQDNALMILALVRSYEAETSQNSSLTLANATAYFMISNLYKLDPETNYYAFIHSVQDDLTVNDNTLNLTANALAIMAFCELYRYTRDETLLEAVYQIKDFLNIHLWDAQYEGYFQSNATINGSKVSYDNLLATLANLKILETEAIDHESRVNASYNIDIVLNKFISKWNDSVGFFSRANRSWEQVVWDDESIINALGISCLIDPFHYYSNETYQNVVNSLLNRLSLLEDMDKGGYNWSGTSTTKELEANAWILMALFDAYRRTTNLTLYLKANNLSIAIEDLFYDSINQVFNKSIDFADVSGNDTIEATRENALAIVALLSIRFEDFYLTRANITESLVLANQWVGTYLTPYTFRDFTSFSISVETMSSFQSIMALSKLYQETNLSDYVTDYAVPIFDYLNETVLNSSAGVYSYRSGIAAGSLLNDSRTEDNCLAIFSLIELYKLTNNTDYLTALNKTWYFLNQTVWDANNHGYLFSNNLSNTEKFTYTNLLAILANLEIANLSSAWLDANFPNLRSNASLMANFTLSLILDKMWDPIYNGIFSNATEDWISDNVTESAKDTITNLNLIRALSRFNEIFGNHWNRTDFELKINQTFQFLMSNLYDQDFSGFYIYTNLNGTDTEQIKSALAQIEAISALTQLYNNTLNYTYYRLAEEIMAFVNTYIWDIEYGGYFEILERDGTILEGFENIKFLTTQQLGILATCDLLEVRRLLKKPPIFSIEFDLTDIDYGVKFIDATLTVIDENGLNLSQLEVSIFMSGFERTYKSVIPAAQFDFYGLGQLHQLAGIGASNSYNGTLNISAYFGDFYIMPLILNESYSAIYDTFSVERLIPGYGSSALGITNLVNVLFRETGKDHYYSTLDDTETIMTIENLLAINMLTDLMNATGLNLAIDWARSSLQSADFQFGQIIYDYYINSTMNYFLDQFRGDSQTGKGFHLWGTASGGPFALTSCQANAIGIVTLLDLYELTNDSNYFEAANLSWRYMNETFWDYNTSGFLPTNGSKSSDWKSVSDNLWAALANLEVYKTTQFDVETRNRAYYMGNLTLNKTLSDLWNTGLYSHFNSSFPAWIENTNEIEAFEAETHALAIQSILKYLEINASLQSYEVWLNRTVDFLLTYLWDGDFLGFFKSCNDSYQYFSEDKDLLANSMLGVALADYYAYYENQTIYEYCELISLFTSTYLEGDVGLYLRRASRFGSIHGETDNYDLFSSVYSILMEIRMYELRQTLQRPLELYNFTVEPITAGIYSNHVNISVQLNDSSGNPVKGARLYGVLKYQKDVYETFNFTLIGNNTYRTTINVSGLLEVLTFSIIAFNQTGNFASGYEAFTFYREVPVYYQIGYETVKKLFEQSFNDLGQDQVIFNQSFYEGGFLAQDNLHTIRALLELKESMGSILQDSNWYLNDTYDLYPEQVYNYMNQSWRTVEVNVSNRDVSGFVSGAGSLGTPFNVSQSIINAIAVVTMLELYNATGDSEYLNRANDTWLYLNHTFWDQDNGGYYFVNETLGNETRVAADNFMVMIAAIEINQTPAIISEVRNNALEMAINTFELMYDYMWDTNVSHYGLYYTNASIAYKGAPWNITGSGKSLLGNALACQALSRMYEATSNQTYLNHSKLIHDLVFQHFWDKESLGYYSELLGNFTLPQFENQTYKFLESNSWMAMASLNLFKITNNFSYYLMVENVIIFLNSYFLNLYSQGENVYYTGYLEKIDPYKFYYGDVFTGRNAFMAHLLFSTFDAANNSFWNGASSPWLIDTTNFSSATVPANGDWINSSSAITFSNGSAIGGTLNLTAVVWGWREGEVWPRHIREYNATFDAGGTLHICGHVNISDAEHIFIKLIGINQSIPVFWKVYYVHRVLTSVQFYTPSGQISPNGLKNNQPADSPAIGVFTGYVLGQDKFQINVTYGEEVAPFTAPTSVISSATVNFEVWLPNDQGLYLNRSVRTGASGVATITFGPTPELGQYIGTYIVRITAFLGINPDDPNEFYGTTVLNMSLWVDYGINIYTFASLTDDLVAQGDLLQLNLTLRNSRKLASIIDIRIYGDVFFTNQTTNYSLAVGTHSILYWIKVDERTYPGVYQVQVDLVFDGVLVNEEFEDESTIDVTVIAALEATQIGLPPNIAEDDTRYAVFEIKNRRLLIDLNFSAKLYSSVLEFQWMNETVGAALEDYYFVAVEVLENTPYGSYSGTIEFSWVNYTISFPFTIEIRSNLVIDEIYVPETPFQNQASEISMQLTNQKTEGIYVDIYIDMYLSESIKNPTIHYRYYLEPLETKIINIKILFTFLNSHLSSQKLRVQVKLDGEAYYDSWHTFQPLISVENFILLYILPLIIITIICFLLLEKFHKIEEKEKKKVQTL